MSNKVTVDSFNAFMSMLPKRSSMDIRPMIQFGSNDNNLKLSIQASAFHYSSPRLNNLNNYTHYEVGFPSSVEPMLMPYIEVEGDNPTETVYPYVPVEIIVDIANKYGGTMEVWNA